MEKNHSKNLDVRELEKHYEIKIKRLEHENMDLQKLEKSLKEEIESLESSIQKRREIH